MQGYQGTNYVERELSKHLKKLIWDIVICVCVFINALNNNIQQQT